MDTKRTRLPTHVIRTIAVKASADPRTVARVVAGEPVRGMVADRIREALTSEGIAGHRAA